MPGRPTTFAPAQREETPPVTPVDADALGAAPDHVKERQEQNRLAEDAYEDSLEEAEEAHRDAEAAEADMGD